MSTSSATPDVPARGPRLSGGGNETSGTWPSVDEQNQDNCANMLNGVLPAWLTGWLSCWGEEEKVNDSGAAAPGGDAMAGGMSSGLDEWWSSSAAPAPAPAAAAPEPPPPAPAKPEPAKEAVPHNEKIDAMSVKELRALIELAGLSTDGCIEKGDLRKVTKVCVIGSVLSCLVVLTVRDRATAVRVTAETA